MTSSSTSARRPVVGILFLIAGVAWLLGIIVPTLLVVSGTSWLSVIVDAALTLAFLFLGIGKSARIITRISFFIAAIGWAILTLNALNILATLNKWGVIIALAGTLLSGIFVAMNHLFSRLGDVVFLVASILIAVGLLEDVIKPFLTGTAGPVLEYAEAVLLALAGLLIAVRR